MRLGRRQVLQGAAALAFGASFRPPAGLAASGEIVLANWGGDAEKAVLQAWGGFKEQSGLKLVVDGSGTPQGKSGPWSKRSR